MSYHKDKEINQAIIRLLDALCEWERNTGRRSTLELIPHNPDEKLVLAQDGKPLPEKQVSAAMADKVHCLAFKERKELALAGVGLE